MTLLQLRGQAGFGRFGGKGAFWARLFSSEIFSVVVGAPLVVLAPAIIDFRELSLRLPVTLVGDSIFEELIAFVIGVLVLGRLTAHPDVLNVRFVLPVFTVTYGGVIAIELFTRGEYSGQQIIVSYGLALGWCYAACIVRRRCAHWSIAVVPLGRVEDIDTIGGADWVVLAQPKLAPQRHFDAVVADLHADLGPEWEAFLARTALSGVPIYHATQVREAITGRTQIEHLSENIIGSLVPNSVYAKTKSVVDIMFVILALLVLMPVFVVIGALVMLDSPGSPIFKQRRMGHRGRIFTIYKFRTMYANGGDGKSFTAEDDPRVTKIGMFLRRTRLDEIPQIVNILRGEMSWIGPRPMAIDLNDWYQREIPFFEYRHIVRPGITGWAQVQQGYADEIEGAKTKLYYDFYYIKNFSLWLDILICIKTVYTLASGNGAR